MKPNDFKIIFDSDTHEVDIETLIGCLMHTSNVVQEVNKDLATEKKIEVKIKALEKGSFEIHIELVEKLIQSIFSNDAIQYASGIVTVVGGLYSFVKFLGGKKPKEIIQKGDKFEITNYYGHVTVVQGDVFNIYNENKTVRDSISKQFSVLEKNDEITGFKFESSQISTYIEQDSFSEISKKIEVLENKVKDPIVETLEDKKILIIRPSFSKDLKWDFIYEGQQISAKMDDEEMIKIIDNGEQFSKGDYMLVDLEITKFYDSDLDVHLINKDSYKILKYKEHIISPKQSKLF